MIPYGSGESGEGTGPDGRGWSIQKVSRLPPSGDNTKVGLREREDHIVRSRVYISSLFSPHWISATPLLRVLVGGRRTGRDTKPRRDIKIFTSGGGGVRETEKVN